MYQFQYTSNHHARSNFQQRWQKKPLQSNSNITNINTKKDDQFKMMMEIDTPYIAQCGNESPESTMSANSMFDEELKEPYNEENKSSEIESRKDVQDLTYDEITALLGPNNEKKNYLNQLFLEEKKRENSFCHNINKNERFLDLRLEALQSLLSAVKKCKLETSTGDHALYYFDRLCLMNECEYECIHFIAFLCLWISCKYNETANTMPHIRTLINAYTHNKLFIHFESAAFAKSEKTILSKLKFKLKCVLPIDFIEYYLHCDDNNYCCLYPNDKGYNPNTQKLVNIPSEMAKDIMRYVKFFTDLVNENYSLCNNYKPSILAISIICCSRKALRISPYLNKEHMFDLFNINEITKEMDECYNILWTDYIKKFPKQAKEYENNSELDNKSLIDM